MRYVEPGDEIVRAVRGVEEQRRAALPVAASEQMLGLIRDSERGAAPALAPSLRDAAGLAWRIACWQLRLVHAAVVPFVVLLLAAGTLTIARLDAPAPALGRLHAAFVVVCLALAGVLTAPADVRQEYLSAATVGPPVVLAARLTVLLGSSLVAAVGSSVVLSLAGTIAVTPLQAVTGWLGPAVLVAGAVTWAGVWRGQAVASATGVFAVVLLGPVAMGSVAVVPPLASALIGVLFFGLAFRAVRRFSEAGEIPCQVV